MKTSLVLVTALCGCSSDAMNPTSVDVSADSIVVQRATDCSLAAGITPLDVGQCVEGDDIADQCPATKGVVLRIERDGVVLAESSALQSYGTYLQGNFLGAELVIDGSERILLPTELPPSGQFVSAPMDPSTRWTVNPPMQVLVGMTVGLGGRSCRAPAGVTELPYQFLPVPAFNYATLTTEIESQVGSVTVRATTTVQTGPIQ